MNSGDGLSESMPSDTALQMPNLTIRVARFSPKGDSPDRKRSGPFASPTHPSSRRVRGKRWTQEYRLQARPEDTILDCLLWIKRDQDPTLNFRYSCGHGMCGSDAVLINNTPTLLCTATVGDFAQVGSGPNAGAEHGTTHTSGFHSTNHKSSDSLRGSEPEGGGSETRAGTPDTAQDETLTSSSAWLGTVDIRPIPGFTPLRDLIVDTDTMFNQIRQLRPYLIHKSETDSHEEYLQSPQQLSAYELLSNCITCGVCEGSCPIYTGGEAFLGPAALIAASRFIKDSRDQDQEERLEAINQDDGILACQSVRACSRQCPRGIDVGEEMWKLVEAVHH